MSPAILAPGQWSARTLAQKRSRGVCAAEGTSAEEKNNGTRRLGVGTPGASLENAARCMEDLQVRRLPVISREKRLVGIVSLGDLSQCEPDDAGEALQSISQPTH